MYISCNEKITKYVLLLYISCTRVAVGLSCTKFVTKWWHILYDMFEQITFKGTLVLHNSLTHDLCVIIWDKIWSAVMVNIPLQACCDMPLYVESEYDRLLHYFPKSVLRHNNSVDAISMNPTDAKTPNQIHQAWWNCVNFDPNKKPQACANIVLNLRILRRMRNLRKLQHDVTHF